MIFNEWTLEQVVIAGDHEGYRQGVAGLPLSIQPPNEIILKAPQFLSAYHDAARRGHMRGKQDYRRIMLLLHDRADRCQEDQLER